MNHKVVNVQKLHDDAYSLYNNVVVGGGEASADTILNNLYMGIENLKNNWKGKDAGVQIQNVVRVYNGMVAIRNVLAQLAVDSSKIAANYREIQNANTGGNAGELFGVISFDPKTNMSDYADTTDTIDINPDANVGKLKVDAANNAISTFITNVNSSYNAIMENWLAGTGRDNAQTAFDGFMSSANQYKQVLSEVSSNITNALQNYTI